MRLDAMMERAVGKALSTRPYWVFLLELYLADIEGRTMFQSCLATEGAPANTHRRAAKLADMGILIREPDPDDHRRVDLRLTAASRAMLEHALNAAVTLYRAMAHEMLPDSDINQKLMDRPKIWYESVFGTKYEDRAMGILRGKVIAGGRIALPADVRRSLGLQNGDTVLFEIEGDEVRIRPARSALRRVQERLRAFAPDEGLVSDELIAERRTEASRD
ncbi:AbrB/MazE/SpoVT family DNA-binding domain-containing protein [Sphingomonas sp. QA11]|uniref:AbrB/MazE/SpoVT family DNA-binding domain-containing protein n=1 Tax=Sphingomonas sp. QA11 TaxID=2950605 RepID=UPI00234940EB|nr:AbrB/MazE/SpoVT family DNA-binding domain-containing protein [Sphingomonas sp. QA11]WCM25923.1 AbrB/MazE/SpoVT family DNA-binding domain-containing protein [Sphingomonas sp. QA11]